MQKEQLRDLFNEFTFDDFIQIMDKHHQVKAENKALKKKVADYEKILLKSKSFMHDMANSKFFQTTIAALNNGKSYVSLFWNVGNNISTIIDEMSNLQIAEKIHDIVATSVQLAPHLYSEEEKKTLIIEDATKNTNTQK